MTASPTWPWSLLLLTRRRSPRSRAAAWRGRSRWGSTPIVVPRSSRPSRLADTTPGDDGTQHAMDCSGRPVQSTARRTNEALDRWYSWRVPQESGGQVGQHFGCSSSDAQDPGVAVVPLDLAPVQVTGPAVKLYGFVDDVGTRLDGGLLGQAGFGDDALPIREDVDNVTFRDVARVDPGGLDLPVHLHELVLHDQARDQRLAERLAPAAVLVGLGQRPSWAAVGVYGERDPLDHELLGDQLETRVLLVDQVRRRHAHIDEGEVCGVRAVPAHLGQTAVDGES